MDLQLLGRIKLIEETQEFESGFKKREFVVTTQEQYPQDVKFEFLKDKTTVLDSYKQGDEVNVHFNIRGNEYNGRYFVNLQAWKMNSASNAADSAPIPTPPPIASGDDEDDDLPF